MPNKKLVFVVNVDWYFSLHWLDRAVYFKQAGYEVYVVGSMTQEQYPKKIQDAGLIFIDMNVSRAMSSPFVVLREIWNLAKIIGKISPTLVNAITLKPNIYCGLLAFFLRFPLVCSVTGLGIVFSSRKFSLRLTRVFIEHCYQLISMRKNKIRFLFENKEDLVTLKKSANLYPYQLTKVSGAGVNPNEFLFAEHSSKEGPLKIIFASRLLKSKGLEYLAQAVRQINLESLNCELSIAGIVDSDSSDPIGPEELETICQTEGITFLGQVENIAKILPAYDVVCLPTYYGEGIPRILIEAAAIGRTIVTTPIGGCTEVCINGYNGFQVEPHSVDSIVKVLNILFEDRELLSELGRNGRKLFLENFTNEVVFSEFDSVYSSLLDAPGG